LIYTFQTEKTQNLTIYAYQTVQNRLNDIKSQFHILITTLHVIELHEEIHCSHNSTVHQEFRLLKTPSSELLDTAIREVTL